MARSHPKRKFTCRYCGRETPPGDTFCGRCHAIADADPNAIPELTIATRVRALSTNSVFWLVIIAGLTASLAGFATLAGWLAAIPAVFIAAFVAVQCPFFPVGVRGDE